MFLRLTHTNTQRTAEGDRERMPRKGVSEREREGERGRCGGVNACASHAVPNSKSCLPKTHVLSLSPFLLFALSCCSPSPRHESTLSFNLSARPVLACLCLCACACVSLCALLALNFHFHFSHTQKKNITHTHTGLNQKAELHTQL